MNDETLTYAQKVQRLRDDAAAAVEQGARNPGAAYFASWLLFYMDECEQAREQRDNVVMAARYVLK